MTAPDPQTAAAATTTEDSPGTGADEEAARFQFAPAVDPADHPRPPGPDGLPVVGCTLHAVREGVDFADRASAYGDVVGFDAFGQSFVACYDPDLVEAVLVSENDRFVKGDFEGSLGDLVAPEGLAFATGDQWRRQRTLLQSAFTPDRIGGYAEEMVAGAARAAGDWRDGEVVELGGAYSRLTLRVLTRALFDLDMDAGRGAVVRRATRRLDDYVDSIGLLSVLPDWVPSRTERRYEAAMADLEAMVADLVAERRTGIEDGDTGAGAAGDDLLSLLAAAEYPDGTRMSPDEVRDQLVTFLFAGHETTATGLTFATWLLAGHPEAGDRLREEVDALDGDPAFRDLPELTYTEGVVREALRLYPPVFALNRQPTEPVVVDGYRVTPADTLQLPQWAIHRDERYWDDPEAFTPDRWAADRDRPEYAYFPFGGGPRHCIGMRFAMAELKLVLATVARRVEFERVTESFSLSTGVTIDPGEIEVRVRER